VLASLSPPCGDFWNTPSEGGTKGPPSCLEDRRRAFDAGSTGVWRGGNFFRRVLNFLSKKKVPHTGNALGEGAMELVQRASALIVDDERQMRFADTTPDKFIGN
jgi:hypothetical protein